MSLLIVIYSLITKPQRGDKTDLDGYKHLPFDTLKLLFSTIDISITVKQVEAKYANSGKGRPHYPVRSMFLALMFMRFEAVPSVRKPVETGEETLRKGNPLVSPVFAATEQLKFLPPPLIITASQDSLRKEAEDFRDKLEMAGVKVTHKRFEAPNGFTLG
jgi:acetyl esterase/lipase